MPQGISGPAPRAYEWRWSGWVGVPSLPPATPYLGEGTGAAEDLADLGLALRDAQVGKFRSQLGGGAIAARAAGQRVQAGAPEYRGGLQDAHPFLVAGQVRNRS
jgi:hypothetical protein